MKQTREYFIPYKTRRCRKGERFTLFVLGLASIYEGLVLVLSLGFVNVDARMWVLFESWKDDDE